MVFERTMPKWPLLNWESIYKFIDRGSFVPKMGILLYSSSDFLNQKNIIENMFNMGYKLRGVSHLNSL